MATNYGKKFESVIKESFEKVPNTLVTRLYDSTNGFLGVKTPCDFIVYHYPHQYMIECKSVHGNTLPFSNITDNQWNGLLEASKIKGVRAGVICWFIDNDKTYFLPIELLTFFRQKGAKSFSCDTEKMNQIFSEYEYEIWLNEINENEKGWWHFMEDYLHGYEFEGKKKRVFFDYDMNQFLHN